MPRPTPGRTSIHRYPLSFTVFPGASITAKMGAAARSVLGTACGRHMHHGARQAGGHACMQAQAVAARWLHGSTRQEPHAACRKPIHLSVVVQAAADVPRGLCHHDDVVHDGQLHKGLQRRGQLDVAADGVALQGGR